MAAVQRTPTPMDARTRRDFIESMEDELRRVQEHLDRRHWRHKRSDSATTRPIGGNVRPRQYYTLARSNPSSLRKSSSTTNAKSEAERYSQDDLFCRAGSAQDSGFYASTTSEADSQSSSNSSTSTKSSTTHPPTSPDKLNSIRLRSPLFPADPAPTSPIKSPEIFSTPSRTNIIMPHSYQGPPSSAASFNFPTSPSPTSSLSFSPTKSPPIPNANEVPILAKEVSRQLLDEPKLEAFEYDDTVEKSDSKEVVMPSALDDIHVPLAAEETGSKERQGSEYSNDEPELCDGMISRESGEEEQTSLDDDSDEKEEDDDNDDDAHFHLFSATEMESLQLKHFEELIKIKKANEKAIRDEKEHASYKLAQQVEQLKQQLEARSTEISRLQTRVQKELSAKDDTIKKLTRENGRLKKEKWDLLKKTREATERTVNLKTKLDYHNASLSSVELELDRANDELASVKAANNSLRLLVNELRAPKITNNVETQADIIIVPQSPLSIDIETQTDELPGENDSGHASTLGVDRISGEWSERLSIASSQYDPAHETPSTTPHLERRGRERRSMRNLIKKFRRSSSAGKRHSTSSLVAANATSLDNLQISRSSLTSPTGLVHRSSRQETNDHRLSAMNLSESSDPNSILDTFRSVPFSQWNTKALVAWMEVVAGMPQYTATVRQHVTSGHALLALTNIDIEKRLGITHPLHRRRLRLSIEEARNIIKGNPFPEARNLDHNWVAYTWAVECGLPHLSGALYNGMVDGRVLHSLTKEDIKKYLKVTKKVEQMSFLAGVELLRMHEFRRDVIQSHQQSTNNPLYWNNRDICDWLNGIGLQSYSANAAGAGVHGALLFLERGNFGSDQLANMLHLPGGKSQLKKHLSAQLARLFSNEDIASVGPEDEGQSLEERPPSGPVRAVSPTTSDSSPHPSRHNSLRPTCTSNPDLTEESNEMSNFNRFTQHRTSLRESALRSVVIPDARPQRTFSVSVARRPHSQVVTSTAV